MSDTSVKRSWGRGDVGRWGGWGVARGAAVWVAVLLAPGGATPWRQQATRSVPMLGSVFAWQVAAPGLSWAERVLDDSESAGPVRVIAVRVDPRRYRFRLAVDVSPGGTTPRWTVGEAPEEAVLAFNAGQFRGAAPWGWVVHDGIEARPPGTGPLASAVIFGRDGIVRIVDAEELAATRDSNVAEEAIQSYPTLLRGTGKIPDPLLTAGSGVDIDHRDSRVAVGLLADGQLLIVMTRYGGLGRVLASAPLGPTLREMAALMRRLGCRRAVSLDGGLSSQLLIRAMNGTGHEWSGWRAVPMGVVVTPIGIR